MAVFAVHWCRVTRWLLLWSLKQPTAPLSGILYEKRPVIARSRSAVWSYSEVDYWIGDSLGSPTFKLWETKWLSKWAKPLSVHMYTVVEQDSVLPTLSHWSWERPGQESDSASSRLSLWPVWGRVARAGLSIYYAESLSCVEPCVEPCVERQTQFLIYWVFELCT